MENRTLEKITTILTNLENEKKNEKAKIDAMFEEYTSKVNNALHPYLEFKDAYMSIIKNFAKGFCLNAEIKPMEISGVIDYDEICELFGTELADYFFSSTIAFTIDKNSNTIRLYINNEKGYTVVGCYLHYNDIMNNSWEWIKDTVAKEKNKGLCTIFVEYADVIYTLFEKHMLKDIETKFANDFNSVYNTRLTIEETLNKINNYKNIRTNSVKDIVIQKLIESTELCSVLFDRAEYTITHMSLTNYAIERVNNMSDTELELIYSDIMGIEDELDEN